MNADAARGPVRADPSHHELHAYALEYLDVARVMTMRDLSRVQDPPLASLGFGAGGIAFAAWRHDAADPEVERWLAAAARVARTPERAWLTPAYPTTLAGRSRSVATGPPGIAWLRLRIALSRGREAASRQWARRLVDVTRRAGSPELLLGDAGLVLALTSAADDALARGDAEVASMLDHATDPLHDRLSEAVQAPPAEPGLARGALGLHYALLSLHRRRGAAPSTEQLERLADLGSATVSMRDLEDPLRRSWCNGLAGAVLVWELAHRVTADSTWLELARRDGGVLDDPVDADGDPGTLCCGSGGWAYACLALHALDPTQGWDDRALAWARTAFEHLDSPWQHGLLRGFPGLVCLALDLVSASGPRGFPLVAA